MTNGCLPVVGIYGAGKSGTAVARRALAAGYPVNIASSHPAAETQFIADIVTPGASGVDSGELAARSELLLIAVPLRGFLGLPLEQMAGHAVIDMMNYWPPTDGIIPEFDGTDIPSSVIVRDALPSSVRLVKTLNHIGYHEIDAAEPSTSPSERLAVGVAADDPDAALEVAEFLTRLGYDPVSVGDLERSRILQPRGPVFGAHTTALRFRALIRGDLIANVSEPPRSTNDSGRRRAI